jgi:alkylhydroperoxidase family enzyme
MTVPRIPPLPPAEWDGELREQLEVLSAAWGRPLNIFGTVAHHPVLFRRWMAFGTQVLLRSALPPRERELVILRVGWRCRAPYEWGQHVVIARDSGVTDEEIARVGAGPDAPGWSPVEAALLRAADELHDDKMVSDRTWSLLQAHFDARQLLDLLFLVGQYEMVAGVLNSLRVQRDDGVGDEVPFPDGA